MGIFKIAKQGFDVIKNDEKIKLKTKVETPKHMYVVLAVVFLKGSRIQLKRYLKSIKISEQTKKNQLFIECLHELFNLFEDLNALSKYVKKCGDRTQEEKGRLWLDIRNHIRHDVREEFDNENKNEKNKRALRLKLDSKLQMDLDCKSEYIRVGGITVAIKEIEDYLDWADNFFKDIWEEAKKNGFIKFSK